MPNDKRLIPLGLLNTKTFRDSLQKLLQLSPDQLRELNVLGGGPAGFAPEVTVELSKRASLSIEDARDVLRVASYLYEKCRDRAISPDEGVRELVEVGKDLKLEFTDEKKSKLLDLLKTKDAYESGERAKRALLAVVGHFESLEGVWDIRPLFHRESGALLAKLPVLILNVAWHDTGHTSHEVVFQLDEKDWGEFKEVITKLDQQRDALRKESGSA